MPEMPKLKLQAPLSDLVEAYGNKHLMMSAFCQDLASRIRALECRLENSVEIVVFSDGSQLSASARRLMFAHDTLLALERLGYINIANFPKAKDELATRLDPKVYKLIANKGEYLEGR